MNQVMWFDADGRRRTGYLGVFDEGRVIGALNDVPLPLMIKTARTLGLKLSDNRLSPELKAFLDLEYEAKNNRETTPRVNEAREMLSVDDIAVLNNPL